MSGGGEEGGDLGRRTARGFLWALAAALGGRLLTVAALTVVARILVPEAFGLFTFALVYITYLQTVADLGMGMALIYREHRVGDAAQVAFVVNLVAGICWFALTWWTAPLAAELFGSPEGVPVLRALSVVFLIRGVANTHDALCRKELRFRARLVPELGLAGAKAAVTVALALGGLGVWSLVWGQVVGTAAWAVGLWIVVPWRPGWRWPRGLLGSLLGYGKSILAVNVIAAVVHHADEVLVGRMLGMESLGFYQMGYKVPEMTVILILWQVNTVLFPALSKSRAAGGDLGEGYVEAVRWISLLALPAAAGLALLAEPLVYTLFGGQWGPSIPILQALALYAVFRALRSPAGDVLKAAGRPGLLAGLGVVKAVILVPALAWAAARDAVTVGLAMAAVTALTLPMDAYAAHRLTGFRPLALLRSLAEGVRPTLVLAVVVLGWLAAVGDALPDPLVLAGGVATGGAAYLAAVRYFAPEAFERGLEALRPEEVGSPGRGDR